MAHHQVEAPLTRWPAQAQASSYRPILSTANEESHSSTALTVTTTSPPSLCPETPPLQVTCECMLATGIAPDTLIQCTKMPTYFCWIRSVMLFSTWLDVFRISFGPHGKCAWPAADCVELHLLLAVSSSMTRVVCNKLLFVHKYCSCVRGILSNLCFTFHKDSRKYVCAFFWALADV